MLVTHQNGNTSTPDVKQTLRGLKIDHIKLGPQDISTLLGMCVHPEDIIAFLEELNLCMHKPKPVYTFAPIDAHNEVLMAEGKNYLCKAWVSAAK